MHGEYSQGYNDPSSEESEYSDADASNSEEDNESMDSDVESSDDVEDNPAFQEWYQQALDDTEDTRDQKYKKYIREDGLAEGDAAEKAHEKALWLTKKIFFENYAKFLRSMLHVQENEVHQIIVADLEEMTGDGVDIERAVKKVLLRHKPKFEGLFEYEEMATDEEEEEEDDMEEDEDTTETDESE